MRSRPSQRRRYLRPRRPLAEEVMQLEREYDEFNRARKRIHKDDEENDEAIVPLKNMSFARKNHSQSIL